MKLNDTKIIEIRLFHLKIYKFKSFLDLFQGT